MQATTERLIDTHSRYHIMRTAAECLDAIRGGHLAVNARIAEQLLPILCGGNVAISEHRVETSGRWSKRIVTVERNTGTATMVDEFSSYRDAVLYFAE